MFIINCTNKGCGKSTQAVIDPKTNEVFCTECDRTISGITSFTKNQLKNLKQIKRPKKEPYSTKCPDCGNEGLPKLEKNNLCCKGCGVKFTHITKPFEILTKEAIQNQGKEDL